MISVTRGDLEELEELLGAVLEKLLSYASPMIFQKIISGKTAETFTCKFNLG